MLERIILFGASGDLTARLLLPAVAQVAEAGLLPEGLRIVGSARDDWTSSRFREHIRERLDTHADDVSPSARERVLHCLSYEPSDVTEAGDVTRVVGVDHPPTLVYLALPSFLLEQALLALSEAGLSQHDSIAIEKPFGVDQTSARRLNQLIAERLPHPTIFRIDHFLSDELVRRILALRFMNRLFEPTLNCQHVERVEISWLESLALEGRAGYYDRAGALKDMIQNHLLEALSLVVMHQPVRLDDGSFRSARVEALRAVDTPTQKLIESGAVRGRYTAGAIGDLAVPAYVDEPGVDASRRTETYASVELSITTPRWQDAKFILRSGKALARNQAEVSIHFRRVPAYFGRDVNEIEPNVLRIGLLEPYVRLDANVNRADFDHAQHQLVMRSERPARTPYANLILEMLRGRPMLFIRGDETEEAWRIVDPIAQAFEENLVPLIEYPAGSSEVAR